MRGAWHTALAYALTGREVDLGEQDAPDVPRLVAELRERGIEPDGRRHPVPPQLAAGLSYAQLAAAERLARDALGISGTVVRPTGRRTRLDADERRLSADRPPHWG